MMFLRRCLSNICLATVVLTLLWSVPAPADPPVLPPTPPPQTPCNPLVCLQITDVEEFAPSSFRFEFEALNWTAFTDRVCPPNDPGCINRTSVGAQAEGLVFVRSASLSTVPFKVLPVDPNGAPLGTQLVTEALAVLPFPAGGRGLELGGGFVAAVLSVTDTDTATAIPSACYELVDPVAGRILLNEDMMCDPFTGGLVNAEVAYEVHQGPDGVAPNTWASSLCTQDQIIWSKVPGLVPELVIPPGDSNVRPTCPTTCAEKDSLGNVLDGFVVEVEDFQPGDRLVFNWYLLGASGPIASGAVPTPTDPGTLTPSPRDPWGFSFGSYQIDRKGSCSAGDCDTVIVTTPPVTDPLESCLVDEDLDRDSLPFDIYVSLGPAGTDPPCRVEPAVAADGKGLERLVVRATSGAQTDQIRVLFRNLATNNIDKSVQFPLHSASIDIPTDDLVGTYEVTGTCENTVTRQFFFLDSFEMAIPRRGDLAEVAAETLAVEIDEAAGTFVFTGIFAPGALDLGAATEVCHFVQVRDRDGNTRIFGTDGPPDGLSRNGALLVRDVTAPQLVCGPDISVGTDADGGADCSLDVQTTASATDAAGGFVLTNNLDGGSVRSFGTTVGGAEQAVLTARGVATVGVPLSVGFTAADDAGAAVSCTTGITLVDDTGPVVQCRLVPDGTGTGGTGTGQGPGGGGAPGQGPGGNGPPGQGGGNGGGAPGSLPNSHDFLVEFSATDNCQPGFGLTVDADIDGIAVTDGQAVQITTNAPGTTATAQDQGGRLHIQTPNGGVLTVTATDEAGNVSVCRTDPVEP